MAIAILYQADILIDGVAASTEFCKIKLSLNQAVKENTTFGDVARKNLSGIYEASADGEFYYQTGTFNNTAAGFTANKLETATAGPSVTFTPLILQIGADQTIGNLVNIWRGVSVSLSEGAQHGDVNKGTLSAKGAGDGQAIQALRLLRSQQSAASSGVGTAINLGATASTQRLYAALNVVGTTNTAAGTVFIIQSAASSGMGTPTTRVTFVLGTSQTGAEWQGVTSTTSEPWYQARWTGFPGTAFTAAISAGIQ